jgi:hypothetical protein
MWRIRHINWINNMLMNASIQRIFLSNLHGSEQLQVIEESCESSKFSQGFHKIVV